MSFIELLSTTASAIALGIYFVISSFFGALGVTTEPALPLSTTQEAVKEQTTNPQALQQEDLQPQPKADGQKTQTDKQTLPLSTPSSSPATVEQKTQKTIVETPLAPPATPTPANFTKINEDTRAALVNVLCRTSGRTALQGISGSGIIIDPSGIVLTNAHIAQFQLLAEHYDGDEIECVLRTGSPARRTYRVELVYISPEWVRENAHKLLQASPTGTGEHDFAFLRITEHVNSAITLPKRFPSIAVNTTSEDLALSDQVLVAAYPAGFLGSAALEKYLFQTSAVTMVQKFFSFTGEFIDLISIGGSVVAQKGSSGGAVVDQHGILRGLVVTSTKGETTAERDLRAILTSHINRSLKEETGVDFEGFLQSNHKTAAQTFRTTIAPELATLLTTQLK